MRFQKGQFVAVMSGGDCRAILQVAGVTPTGRTTLSNGVQYRDDGTEMGSNKYDRHQITEITSEIRHQMKNKSYTNRLASINWHNVSFEVKAQIIALLNKEEKTK